jgi:hypothetical protein
MSSPSLRSREAFWPSKRRTSIIPFCASTSMCIDIYLMVWSAYRSTLSILDIAERDSFESSEKMYLSRHENPSQTSRD